MAISRKSFLTTALASAAAVAVSSPLDLLAKETRVKGAQLNLSFNESVPVGETLEEKVAFMQRNGVIGFEPNGKNLAKRIPEFERAFKGTDVRISAICAGFQGFILAEDKAQQQLFYDTYTDILAAAGELGSVGVVMVPAFLWNKPAMPNTTETREYLVDKLREIGEIAVKHNTSIILEPLNRKEAHYLRQVGDAAMICKDVNSAGVKPMGDFWHMTGEETCDYSALYSARENLAHIHIASRGRRKMPGEDGDKDNYMDGFRALKDMGYKGYVSFECGCASENKEQAIVNALELIRDQWKKA